MSLLVETLTVLDRYCVRFASSVEQAPEHKSKSVFFKSHVRVTFYLEYILYMIIYDIHIFSKYISYIALLYATSTSTSTFTTVRRRVSQQCNKTGLTSHT